VAINWFKYASPATFYPLAGKMIPWFVGGAVLFAVAGLYTTFFETPLKDYQMGQSYKIMFIHVPAAWMSMFIYLVMAMWAAAGFIWNTRLSAMMASALAPTGAMFTFVALWTGALWGKPTWGTWWVWDARLTSELILLFLYIGYIALESAIEEPRRAARACGLLAIVGVINVPIIYKSVEWWNSLHQPASIGAQKLTMGTSMFVAIILMTLCLWFYAIAVALSRVRSVMLEREKNSDWVAELVEKEAGQ
jgi:heme exporter protein C